MKSPAREKFQISQFRTIWLPTESNKLFINTKLVKLQQKTTVINIFSSLLHIYEKQIFKK